MIWGFILGFLTRAAIAYVSAQTYDWRQRRAWRHYVLRRSAKEETIMRWKVKAVGIRWDVGYAEDYDDPTYDTRVAALPSEIETIVTADDDQEAAEKALEAMSDAYSFLIEDTQAVHIELLKRRRTD